MAKDKKKPNRGRPAWNSRETSGLMDEQLYRFADSYYHAIGSQKRYKFAAIDAGANPDSAHTLGSRWAKLPQVQEYWKSLDESVGRERRAVHMRALERHEEFATNLELDASIRIGVNQTLIEETQSAFDVKGDDDGQATQDAATMQTMLELVKSMQLAFGGDSDY